MKLNLNKEDERRLKSLFRINDNNIGLSEFVMDSVNAGITKQNFYGALHIYKTLDLEFGGFNEKDIWRIEKLGYEQYTRNPYYQRIKVKDTKYKQWSIEQRKYDAMQVFVSDDVRFAVNFREVLSLGYFEEDFSYLSVIQNDKIWMAVTPNEIRTAAPYVEAAHGKVLTFGLGLGYYAYMVSLKKDVESVTVVETDCDVVELFTKNILPLFEHPEKIHIVTADAYDYLRDQAKMKQYDYVYIDIWHDAEDGVCHYVRLKGLEKQYKTSYHYWLEPSMIAYLRRLLIALIEEQKEGFDDEDYKDITCVEDALINQLYRLTKDLEFKTFNEIKTFLSVENIKKLASEIDSIAVINWTKRV